VAFLGASFFVLTGAQIATAWGRPLPKGKRKVAAWGSSHPRRLLQGTDAAGASALTRSSDAHLL
jgi:hypothetical protein